MKDKFFIDSNVLVYSYSYSEPDKNGKAWDILKEKDKIIISSQVIGEFINVLFKKHKIEKNLVSLAAKKIIKIFGFKLIYPETIEKALFIFERYKFSYYDSLIIASAIENGCDILYSEDMQHKQVIDDKLTIINPFV